MTGFAASDRTPAEAAQPTESEDQAQRERLRRGHSMSVRQRLQALESRGRLIQRLRAQRPACGEPETKR